MKVKEVGLLMKEDLMTKIIITQFVWRLKPRDKKEGKKKKSSPSVDDFIDVVRRKRIV